MRFSSIKKELLVVVLLLLFTVPAVKALFIPGGYTSHDLTHHVIRQISMSNLLSEGQFPPRWSGELNRGFGYPVFLFNYPLPSLIGQVFYSLGFSAVDSVKAVLFLSMVVSGLGMYLFLRSFLGKEQILASFLGSIFYLYAPIRFLNVYVSASVGSALALAFIPFVFWCISRSSKVRSVPSILLGVLFTAGLILSHNVTALMFAPVFLIFGLLVFKQSEIKTAFIKQIGLMFILGLGLSAFFWLPALMEKEYLRYDVVLQRHYADQFPTLWQLLRSPWGYGLSHPERPEPGDMSYQLGLIHIAVMILGLGFWLFYIKIQKIKLWGGFCLVLFLGSLFLMQKVSLPLWDNFKLLQLVQFPLRFSSVAIFAASIMAALFVSHLPYKKIVFIVLLILVLYANRNHWNINERFDPGEDYYLNLKSTTSMAGEHLPKWGRIATESANAKFEVIEGEGIISILEDKSAKVIAEVETNNFAKLRFNQFYFPGWVIKMDGEYIGFEYLTDEHHGLPVFKVSKGRHILEARFVNTPIRNTADILSVGSLILWIGLLAINTFKIKMLPKPFNRL